MSGATVDRWITYHHGWRGLCCTCCGRSMAASQAGYRARLGVYRDVVLPSGARAAQRVNTCEVGLCRACFAAIERGYQVRQQARRVRHLTAPPPPVMRVFEGSAHHGGIAAGRPLPMAVSTREVSTA